MAEKILSVNNFFGGISSAEKIGLPGAFGDGSEFLDYSQDPNQITIQPKGTKVSGSTVVDLVKWIVDASPHDTNKYFYGDAGNIYRETSAGTWSNLRTVTNSVGQGMAVVNDYVYYTQNSQIGRYGPLSAAPAFQDDWQTGLNSTATSTYAPIQPFRAGFVVGHGNYLAYYDGSVWDVDRIVLPPGFQVRALTQVQETIVGAMWRSDGAITDTEEGYIFLWDGDATFVNNFYRTNGAPNALAHTGNRLLSFQGSSGQIYTDIEPFSLIHQIPNLGPREYVEVLPGATTTWQGQTYFGSAGNTDSTTVKHGIYSYGAKSNLYPEALNYTQKISTGTQTGTGIKVGALMGSGNQLYWSWKDSSTYGVDRVTSASTPAASATYISLVHDDERPGHDKMPKVILATHKALLSGESVQIGYKRDRAANFTTETANSTVGTTSTRASIPGDRYKEFEFEVILATSGSTAPSVTGINYLFDDLREEEELI